MTLLRPERAQHANTLTTVGSDFLSPSILSVIAKGAQMVELCNALGVDLVYDPNAKSGKRLRSVTVGGNPVVPDAPYRVATSDYMAASGDGYAVLTHGNLLSDTRFAQLMATTVADSIERHGTVAPQLEGRITAR